MSSQTKQSTALVASTRPGQQAWAVAGDQASVSLAQEQPSGLALATDFGFTIPDGAAITGVMVEILVSSTSGGVQAGSDGVVLVLDSTPRTDADSHVSGDWPASSEWLAVSSDDELWGLGPELSPAAVNDEEFGVGVGAYNGGSAATATLHACRVSVYYE